MTMSGDTFIERYRSQSNTLRPQAELDLKAQRQNLTALRDAARKALAERHQDEFDALEADFNKQFDILNGRGPR
jgi:hypothetical protein